MEGRKEDGEHWKKEGGRSRGVLSEGGREKERISGMKKNEEAKRELLIKGKEKKKRNKEKRNPAKGKSQEEMNISKMERGKEGDNKV